MEISNILLQANQTIYVRFKNANGYWTAPRGITYTGAGMQRGIPISYAEYFIGADPGRGKGKPIPVTSSTTANLELPALSLQKGQRLSIRLKDAENRWSTPMAISYAGVGGKRAVAVTYAEYFIDHDPGRGKGTSITIDQAIKLPLKPPALSLKKGQKIFFRIKDAENRWSEPAAISYSDFGVTRRASIVYAEYFVGADPGRGKGTKIAINPADSVIVKSPGVVLSKGQKLQLRVQDTEKRWSEPAALSYPPRSILAAEIVVANDPSKVPPGKGIPMTPADGAFNSAYEALQGTASWNRRDSIWVRARSSEQIWSKPVGNNVALNPVPSLTSVKPVSGERLQTLDVVLTGTKFVNGATVSFGPDITVTIKSVTPTQINATISIGENAATGPRDVTVTNRAPGGGTAKLAGAFMVKNPVPTLSSVAPKEGERGQTLDVVLTGTKFLNGATVSFGPNITVTIKSITPTQINATISIGENAATGPRDVTVTNPTPGGGTAKLAGAFTVKNPIPALSSVTPKEGERGQTLDVVLTGTKFLNGATVSFGPDITMTIKSITPTQINATIAIGVNAATGPRDVTVTNPAPGGGTAKLPGAFTVKNPVPTLNSGTPKEGERGQTLEVILTGTKFVTGATVSFGPDITVIIKSITPTQINATISIGVNAATGPRDVTVTNPAPGGGTAKLAGAFTVKNPVPTLSSITPKSSYRGQTLNVGCKGNKFFKDVSRLMAGESIKVNNVVIHRVDSLTANVTIANKATPGQQSLTVVNDAPGGGISEARIFTIMNHAPTSPSLLMPANRDTIRLITPAKPIKFVWRKSLDRDSQDTLHYMIHLKGPGFDTTIANIKDTSIVLNVMSRFKVKSNYLWTVSVKDGFTTVASPEFSFRTETLTGIRDALSQIPVDFRLEHNYPNPFKPATKILYELPKQVKVSLKVYDMLSHEVAVLVDEEKPPGKYEVVWRPKDLSSGVYFYRLQAGDFVQVKKMILAK